jgi:hypothetical protein
MPIGRRLKPAIFYFELDPCRDLVNNRVSLIIHRIVAGVKLLRKYDCRRLRSLCLPLGNRRPPQEIFIGGVSPVYD